MARLGNDNAGERKVGDDLEPYRRLVELQKQMIELAEKHEEAKRRRDALHEEVVRTVVNRRRANRNWRHYLPPPAARLLELIPGFPAGKPDPDTLNHKSSSLSW